MKANKLAKHIISTANNHSEQHEHILHKLRRAERNGTIDLHTAYSAVISAMADNWLLQRLLLHCELHREPMPLQELNATAATIYRSLIQPPEWHWRTNLHKRLIATATTYEYKSISDYLHTQNHTNGGFIHCTIHAAPPFTPTPATSETP